MSTNSRKLLLLVDNPLQEENSIDQPIWNVPKISFSIISIIFNNSFALSLVLSPSHRSNDNLCRGQGSKNVFLVLFSKKFYCKLHSSSKSNFHMPNTIIKFQTLESLFYEWLKFIIKPSFERGFLCDVLPRCLLRFKIKILKREFQFWKKVVSCFSIS